MKFGQLIEYTMRNIFVKKSYTMYGGETIPRLFSKSNFRNGLFLLYTNLRAIEIY